MKIKQINFLDITASQMEISNGWVAVVGDVATFCENREEATSFLRQELKEIVNRRITDLFKDEKEPSDGNS